VQAAHEYKPKNVLIEDKASGTQLIQDLQADGMYSVTRYDPKMEKIMRMHSVCNPIESGLVHIPAQADWLPQYLHEMAVFPNGKYDDQVDSTSQALDWVKDGVLVLGVVEYIRSEEAKLGLRSQSHAAETRKLKVVRNANPSRWSESVRSSVVANAGCSGASYPRSPRPVAPTYSEHNSGTLLARLGKRVSDAFEGSTLLGRG